MTKGIKEGRIDGIKEGRTEEGFKEGRTERIQEDKKD